MQPPARLLNASASGLYHPVHLGHPSRRSHSGLPQPDHNHRPEHKTSSRRGRTEIPRNVSLCRLADFGIHLHPIHCCKAQNDGRTVFPYSTFCLAQLADHCLRLNLLKNSFARFLDCINHSTATRHSRKAAGLL